MPKKITHEEYVEKLARENPTIELLSQYNGNKQYITVKCKIDGTIWKTKPNWLKAGRGCQTCYDNRRGQNRVKGLEKFIEEARKVHGDKYDYCKVEYINDTKKVCVICPNHGEFWISPAKHLRYNQGCPTCGRRRIDTNDFIQRARLIHGDKYDYSKTIYAGRFKPVTIICPIHGAFSQKPDKHLSSHGCPICKESKTERLIREKLKENDIQFESQKRFTWLGKQTLDFFIPEQNIAIECQGEQHFHPVSFYKGIDGFEKTRIRDLMKYEKCTKHGIKVLYYINSITHFVQMEPYTKENIIKLSDLDKLRPYMESENKDKSKLLKDLTHFNSWLD